MDPYSYNNSGVYGGYPTNVPTASLPAPVVPQVQPLNVMGAISAGNQAANQQMQTQETAQGLHAQNALSQYLAAGGDPNGAADYLNSLGYGPQAQAYQKQLQANQEGGIQNQMSLQKYAAAAAQNINSEEDKQRVLDQIVAAIPSASQYVNSIRSLPWQQVKQGAANMIMGPQAAAMLPGQIANQGLQGKRTQQEIDQSAEMQPHKIAETDAATQYYGARSDKAETQAANAQPKTIMVEQSDPTDPWGKRKIKVPMQYQADGTLAPVPQSGGSTPPTASGTQSQAAPGATPPPVGATPPSAPEATAVPGAQPGATSGQTQTQGKPLDAVTARAYLQKAAGDKVKARAMAQADGYTF
jgi:hypothetical protein